MSALKILWLVDGVRIDRDGLPDSALASSRYRAILPGRGLAMLGHRVEFVGFDRWVEQPEDTGTTDVIVVGKMLETQGDDDARTALAKLPNLIAKARAGGIRVVADFCDDHFDHPRLGPVWRAVALDADHIVCATDELALRLDQVVGRPSTVIGDPVGTRFGSAKVFDAAASAGPVRRPPWLGRQRSHVSTLRIAWYGIPNNWPAMAAWADMLVPLARRQHFEVAIVTRSDFVVLDACRSFNDAHAPGATLRHIDWSIAAQAEAVEQSDLVLVPNDPESSAKRVKSANRVCDALASGRYVVASPLPAYRPYAAAAVLTNDPLGAVATYLSDPVLARERILRGQALAREFADPARIAEAWENVLKLASNFGGESIMADRRVDGTQLHHSGGSTANLVSPRRVPRVSPSGSRRIVLLAPGQIPTLHLRFLTPLQSTSSTMQVVTEADLNERFGAEASGPQAREWLLAQLAASHPTHLVFCRYAGPHVAALLSWARANRVASMLHLDDDLLDVPWELGRRKFEFHHRPERLHALDLLLRGVDLVQTANHALALRIRQRGYRDSQISTLSIPCGTSVVQGFPSGGRDEFRIGYMGIDHDRDLALVVPVLSDLLDIYPHLVVELFGPLELPAELEAFGLRVRQWPPISPHGEFMRALAARNWHVGICPLESSPFNSVKTHIKWVEYSAVGAAVVASAGTIYDECCAFGKLGALAANQSDWHRCLAAWIESPDDASATVARAQQVIRDSYRTEQLAFALLADLDRSADHSQTRQRVSDDVRDIPPIPYTQPVEPEAQGEGCSASNLPSYAQIHQALRGKVSDKWSSYFAHYDRLLGHWRHAPVRLLEIGVQNGGSLDVWSRYFAAGKIFIGCDIDPACGHLRYDDARVHVVVGDATRMDVATRLTDRSAVFDIVIDDGSHRASDIVAAFLLYFPCIAPGGVFIAEDTHTMYMPGYGGGLLAPTSAHEFFKCLVDLVNRAHWLGQLDVRRTFGDFATALDPFPDWLDQGWVERVEFMDSMVVVHKASRAGHDKLGTRSIAGVDATVRPEVLRFRGLSS